MSDLQLERSVLEAKERDELFAIALALGSSPPARTKKADLVSHILQVTGVDGETAPIPEKPRRSRAARSGTTSSEVAAPADDNQQLELATTNGNGAQAATTEQSNEVSNGAPATTKSALNGGTHAGAAPKGRAPERGTPDDGPSDDGAPDSANEAGSPVAEVNGGLVGTAESQSGDGQALQRTDSGRQRHDASRSQSRQQPAPPAAEP